MSATIYLETSVVSYLTARPARDVVSLAHQQVTRDWWAKRRSEFELYTSDIVVAEARQGDPTAAAARMDIIRVTRQLPMSAAAERLVPALLSASRLPAPKALADISHIALATAHRMQFLLTWNCKHIANAMVIRAIEKACQEMGYELPVICTPEELMEV